MSLTPAQFADAEAAKLSKLPRVKAGRGVEALVDFDVLTPTEEFSEDYDPFAVRTPASSSLQTLPLPSSTNSTREGAVGMDVGVAIGLCICCWSSILPSSWDFVTAIVNSTISGLRVEVRGP